MIQELGADLDSERKMGVMTKLFESAVSTPKPPGQGMNFNDVQLNNKFEITWRKTIAIVGFPIITEQEFSDKKRTLCQYLEKL